MSAIVFRPRKSRRSARGFTTAPESMCEPGALPFSRTATGTSPGLTAIGLSAALPLAHELRQLRHDRVQVADDAEVGVLEDRRVRVLVDGDDHVRGLHPDLVLDRAGDTARDVELGRDRLAGLADLRRVR